MDGQMSIWDYIYQKQEQQEVEALPCLECKYDDVNGCCNYMGEGYCVLGDKFEPKEESNNEPNWDYICSFIYSWRDERKACREFPKTNTSNAPVVPKWHMSLNHVWCECPKCKMQPDGLTRYIPPSMTTEGYDEYNTHCPWCGQPILWDWDEIDRQSVQTNDWKWETVKEDMIAQGDCIGCKESRAVGRKLCCLKANGRWVGDDEQEMYRTKGHPSWCSRIKK